jgi:folate-dependent phosphoribosylglycinamide formyltransferase PurN
VRVAVVSNGNFFSTRMLAPLFADPGIEVTGAILVRVPPGSGGRLRTLLRLTRRTGLRYALYKAASLAAPRAEGLLSRTPIFLHHLCDRHAVPYESLRSANGPDALAALRSWTPEVLVSVSSPERLAPEVLALGPMAAVNVHWGLLPRYAGVAPYFWVLRNGEPETGVTVHLMSPELDTGPVLRQRRLAIDPEETALGLQLRLTEAGGEELLSALKELPGSIEGAAEQDPNARSYFTWPTREDVRALRSLGRRLARLRDYRRMGDLLDAERERQREADRTLER